MKRERLFKTIFILLSISLLLPFSRIYLFDHVVNLSSWINLVLFLILFSYFIFLKHKSIFVILFFLSLTFYVFLGLNKTSDSLTTFYHLFTYFPFIIAVLLLETNVRYDIKKTFFYFSICAGIGSISAILIQYLFQDIFYIINYDVDNIESKLEWGRISWLGSIVVLPLLTQIEFLDIYSKKEKFFITLSLFTIILGLVLTFNRTHIVGLTLLILYILLVNTGNFKFKKFVIFSLLTLFSIFVINYLSRLVPNIENLIEYRVLGFFRGQSDITGDIESRQILYDQYIENILENNLLGQGFGLPFSTIPEPRAWSDITLVSFIIPMGIIGVILFVVFIIKISRKIVNNINNSRIRRLFLIVLLISLLISFNDDIWSHKNFPIYFVFLINSFQQRNLKLKQHLI